MEYWRNGVKYTTPDLTTEELATIQLEQEAAEREYWQSITYDEAVDARIREKYSVSQEFAILRQQNTKPDEYADYYSYCESCKEFVKAKKAEYNIC